MTRHAITLADLFDTAWRNHLAGIGARLCPRVPFGACDSRGCRLALEMLVDAARRAA